MQFVSTQYREFFRKNNLKNDAQAVDKLKSLGLPNRHISHRRLNHNYGQGIILFRRSAKFLH